MQQTIQRSRVISLLNNPHHSFLCRHQEFSTTTATANAATSLTLSPTQTITPVNEAHLLRICTILYQQQDSPESKLHRSLAKASFLPNHEFFLQVCNKFPYSWKPVYKFHQFVRTQIGFHHNSTTFNRMIDVVGKSRNIDLLWELLHQSGNLHLVTSKTFVISLKILASARELKKCVQFFHLMNDFGYPYSLETLNKTVEALCRFKLVSEAEHLVLKLKDCILPNRITYRWLIHGFCDVGNLIEASKVWNLMVDEGFNPDVEAIESMLEAFFKAGKYEDGLKLFQSLRVGENDNLCTSTYRLVICWLCKKGKIGESYHLIEDMEKRSIELDNDIFGSMIYGLLSKGRLREAYQIFERIEKPDIVLYHGMMKGLLRLKKRSEATQVFRDMIIKGCEPTMHTYIMLLQGHMGKRGRKGLDPLVNFDTIFVGGLVKAGKSLEATKYVERTLNRGLEVPRFDFNKFLHYYSNEEGVVMFDVMSKKLREAGQFDLADILERYGLKMATRDRRRNRISS